MNSDIDKAFTDRAWSEMKAMLDREMPVENEKKKPVFWWWLSGALITGLIIGGLGMWYVDAGSHQKKLVPSENPVEEPLNRKAPVAANTPARENPAGPSFAEGKFTEGKKAQKNAAPVNTQSSKNDSPEVQMPVNKAELLAELPEAPTKGAAEAKVVTAEDELPARRSMLPAVPLDNPAMPPLKALSDAEPVRVLSADLSAPKHKSFYFAAQQHTSLRGFGLAAGIQRHYPLGTSRWELSIGAGYSYLQRPLFIRQEDTISVTNFLEVAHTEYGFEQINADLFAAAEAITTNRRQDLAMHYLELPLSVSRSFNGRFGAMTGVTPSVLLATAPELTSGGLFRNTAKAESAIDMEPDPGSPFASDAATVVPVRGFDVKLNGGVYYRISPVWKLSLSYEHGLVDVLEGNKTREYHRFLRLGLNFNPSGK